MVHESATMGERQKERVREQESTRISERAMSPESTMTQERQKEPMTTFTTEPRVPIEKLARDVRDAAATLSDSEARYLVDYYYLQQENRKRSDHQVRLLVEGTEPNEVVRWLARNDLIFEKQILVGLQDYVNGHLVGRWADSIHGVGPVISAGLLAHIDITKAPTVGHIWRFAGLDPTSKWLGAEKASALVAKAISLFGAKVTESTVQYIFDQTGRGDLDSFRRICTNKKGGITRESLTGATAKRPWNARLKVLTWKIGESFVKVQNSDKDIYGHLLMEYKAKIIEKNLAGEYAVAAVAKLAQYKIGADTEARKFYSGRVAPAVYRRLLAGEFSFVPDALLVKPGEAIATLPPGHIHARAKRWAVKLFLAHWHAVAYEVRFGEPPPLPYILTRPEHAHMIQVPNWPMTE